jgi:hypothetical protein
MNEDAVRSRIWLAWSRRCLRARRRATRSRCQLGPRSREDVFRIGEEEEEESMDEESGGVEWAELYCLPRAGLRPGQLP